MGLVFLGNALRLWPQRPESCPVVGRGAGVSGLRHKAVSSLARGRLAATCRRRRNVQGSKGGAWLAEPHSSHEEAASLRPRTFCSRRVDCSATNHELHEGGDSGRSAGSMESPRSLSSAAESSDLAWKQAEDGSPNGQEAEELGGDEETSGDKHDVSSSFVLTRAAGGLSPAVRGVSSSVGSRISSLSSSSSEMLQDVLQHDRKPGALVFALLAPVIALAASAVASLLASQPRGYRATVQLPNAYGVTVGTPVRVRGSEIGVVVAVNPSLKGVNAVMEIRDEHTSIPRRSSYVANQSGLVKEPLIDITPELPLPEHAHGPKDVDACRREGKIVCEGDVVDGATGVCVDELVGLWVKMGRLQEAERARRYGPDKAA